MVKRDQWEKKLKENKPKVLFLTARHPIQRLISVWNRRFCFGTCSSDQDRKYAKQSLEVLYPNLISVEPKTPFFRNYKEYTARTSLISMNFMPSLIARYWMISQEIT